MLMSMAKKMNEVPVIGIDTGTSLLALGTDGKVRQGTYPDAGWQRTHLKSIPFVGGWYRIADVNKCGAGLIAIIEDWNYAAPNPMLIAVACDMYPGEKVIPEAKVLVGHPGHVLKLRYVVDAFNTAWGGHIDMQMVNANASSGNVVRAAICGLGLRATIITEAPDVSSAYSVKEIALTKSGGVISCTSVGPYRVAVTEKGGRHERGESADRRETAWIASSVTVHDREDVQVFQYYQHRHGHPAGTDTGHGHSRNTAIGCCGKRKHDIQSHIEREHTVSIVVRLAGNPENSCQDCGKRGQMERVVSNDVRSAIVLVTHRKEVVAA